MSSQPKAVTAGRGSPGESGQRSAPEAGASTVPHLSQLAPGGLRAYSFIPLMFTEQRLCTWHCA